MKTKLVGACALALAVTACMAGVAFAKAATAKAPIQGGNISCGANQPSDPVLGTVSFKRVGNAVTVKAALKHGEANKTYKVQLAHGERAGPAFCQEIGPVVEFKTNKKGVGKGMGTINVPAGEKEFFADVDLNGFLTPPGNDTTIVKLP